MSKLNLAEDIILLLLDDDTGKMEDVHANVTEMLMAGAVLMDLGLKGASTATSNGCSSLIPPPPATPSSMGPSSKSRPKPNPCRPKPGFSASPSRACKSATPPSQA